jgi:hypothetical protein
LFLALATRAVCSGQGRGGDSLPPGFEHFYNLEYDQAIEEFNSEVVQHPDVPDGYNHLSQAILYRALHRAGVIEGALVTGNELLLSLVHRPKVSLNVEDDARVAQALSKAVALSQARLKTLPDDTQALYALGVAYSLKANYSFLVHNAWIGALRDGNAARKLHNRVAALDSANVDAILIQGVHDYIVASLPKPYRLLAAAAGFKGDKPTGIRALEHVAIWGWQNQTDAQILLAVLYRTEKKPQMSIFLLENLAERFPRNYLFRFALAQAYTEVGKEAKALGTRRTIESLRNARAPGYQGVCMEKIYLARGTVYLRFDEMDAALENVRIAARRRADDANTTAWGQTRLGEVYDLKGQRQREQPSLPYSWHVPDSRCRPIVKRSPRLPFPTLPGSRSVIYKSLTMLSASARRAAFQHLISASTSAFFAVHRKS